MRPAILCCSLAILMGCSRPDDRAAPASSPTISLADFAGKWKTSAKDDAGTVVGQADLLARADTSGWTLTFPKQKPIPVRVIAVAGDSIVTEAGPYASTRIKGAQITTRAVNRLQNGKLVATIEGRYTIAGRDSVFHLRVEGTREP